MFLYTVYIKLSANPFIHITYQGIILTFYWSVYHVIIIIIYKQLGFGEPFTITFPRPTSISKASSDELVPFGHQSDITSVFRPFWFGSSLQHNTKTAVPMGLSSAINGGKKHPMTCSVV